MKKITKYILPAVALVLGGCSVEAPFSPEAEADMGKFHKASLALEVNPDEVQVRSASVDPADFTVDFVKADGTVEQSYVYAKMPEVVMLPVGTYSVNAHLGDNEDCAWESPYYAGASKRFDVVKDKVVSDIDAVVCKLSNIKVSVVFDPSLGNSDDLKVNVSFKEGKVLSYTPADNRSGYFKFEGASNTLTAVFDGTVDGAQLTETKMKTNLKAGYHYTLTFKLKQPNASGSGDITLPDDSPVKVDATVSVDNVTGEGGSSVTPDVDDEHLEDVVFPEEGGNDDPNTPDDPEVPITPVNGPVVTANQGIDLNKENVAADGVECVLTVTSQTGITGFTVEIDSETLSEEILQGVGLCTKFDMITGKSLIEIEGGYPDLTQGLKDLGFPVKDEVEGKKTVDFPITDFMGLLGVYGAAHHKFILTVTDESGTNVTVLKLQTL